MSEVKVNKISPRTNCGTTQLGDAGDTITVSGDLKSNSLKPATGTTLTLGASGDTVTLASGASQSGFGRTGTVDWQTGSIKTADFTATNGEGYFVNTTSGAVTVTLPSSPSAGNIVAISDYAGTSASNTITVGRNSSNIEGEAENATITTNREARTYVYVDGTQGWVSVYSNESATIDPAFVSATGGNTTATCGDFKIHTFTGPGTFTVSNAGNSLGSNYVDYLVLAGGGGGGQEVAGGGGAGGFRESKNPSYAPSWTSSPLVSTTSIPVTAQGYPITVGGGGTAGGPSGVGNGNPSVFSTITSTGGGAGGAGSPVAAAQDGGSGGGGKGNSPTCFGAGNTPPVSPPQGQNGGAGVGPTPTSGYGGGGGGGAGAAGSAGTVHPTGGGVGGTGASGANTSITGSPTAYAAGGGGGSYGGGSSPGTWPGGPGGNPGAGNGGAWDNDYQAQPAKNGTPASGTNRGMGGGGGGSFGGDGGAGSSGVVVIRYKFQ
jgi:hypothetical protein